MAFMSPVINTKADLILFGRWAQRKGFWVWEHSQFYKFQYGPPGTFRVNPVHAKNSFHSHDLALDINWPNAGAERYHILNTIIPMCERLGFSYIYAAKGTHGSARNHTGHIHVDCGSSSNNGAYYFRTPNKKVDVAGILGFKNKKRQPHGVYISRKEQNPMVTQVLQLILRAYDKNLKVDGVYGAKTEALARIWQRGLGVKADGIVGPATWRAYLARAGTLRRGSTGNPVRLLQAVLGLTRDGKFGPATEEAVKEAQNWAGLTADGVFGKNSRNKLIGR
jgi:hypothetical protein